MEIIYESIQTQWAEDVLLPKFCPFLEMEISYTNKSPQPNLTSIDRIIPNLGYVKGNVQVISMLANSMKSSATPEQLKTFSMNFLKSIENGK